ncbi:hypothetical protein [Streptomyces sp. 1-11]|uniref:hypothetical protein n=1 Tax=Streptomyces sp. 1-11 TaxID=2590549 RepID=UPI0011684C26|nr:hypothetical protein [Streptomyces sp. 1-11]GEK03506.1 hypothetical protein TNCT1_57820 [Streptomyces sp. 1-11]
MDQEEQREEPVRGPVVRVPVHPAEVRDEGRHPGYVEAPLESASHWDERIWGPAWW